MAAPIPPDYVPAPLKTTEEIFKKRSEIDETFFKANKHIEAEKTD